MHMTAQEFLVESARWRHVYIGVLIVDRVALLFMLKLCGIFKGNLLRNCSYLKNYLLEISEYFKTVALILSRHLFWIGVSVAERSVGQNNLTFFINK